VHNLQPTKVQITGDGLRVDNTASHPAGVLFSGGYDADSNVLYLAGVMGHPRGVKVAGGEPSNECVSGLRLLIVDTGKVYWATDSMSLPRGLNQSESESVRAALEDHFQGHSIHRVEKLEDIPK
jgi:hypothetical protein